MILYKFEIGFRILQITSSLFGEDRGEFLIKQNPKTNLYLVYNNENGNKNEMIEENKEINIQDKIDEMIPKANSEIDKEAMEQEIIGALKTVYDPEIPVDVWELGLIYGITIDDAGNVKIDMTLTAPGCPVAGSLPIEVRTKAESVPNVRSADVNLVWQPAWDKDMMSMEAKFKLGFM